MRARLVIVAVAVMSLLGETGCVPLAVVAIRKHKQSSRADEIKQQLDPLMGRSKEDVLAALGPPT